MPRGGKRPGAGRKRGVPSQKTINRLKVAEQAAAEGISPLEVMLNNMRALWEEGTKESKAAACRGSCIASKLGSSLSAAMIARETQLAC